MPPRVSNVDRRFGPGRGRQGGCAVVALQIGSLGGVPQLDRTTPLKFVGEVPGLGVGRRRRRMPGLFTVVLTRQNVSGWFACSGRLLRLGDAQVMDATLAGFRLAQVHGWVPIPERRPGGRGRVNLSSVRTGEAFSLSGYHGSIPGADGLRAVRIDRMALPAVVSMRRLPVRHTGAMPRGRIRSPFPRARRDRCLCEPRGVPAPRRIPRRQNAP